MFTGIVQEAGIIAGITHAERSIELTVRAGASAQGLKIGDSFAVNGCCLTAVQIARQGDHQLVQFDLLRETWQRTNLQFAKVGARVNLERPLRADGEFGGHFVTGHIDGCGEIVRREKSGADHLLEVAAPAEVMRYLIFKGSVAVDGISLTVTEVLEKCFRLWIIPHTYEVTALRERQVGDAVNLEADMLGKYVEKFLAARNLGQ